MSFSAKVIAHSSSEDCPDLITMEVSYPRFIHSEVMTHREFSRNASSSRAIPVARMLKNILSDPAGPVHWGTNMPGMQALYELSGVRLLIAKGLWQLGCYTSVGIAWAMMKAGAHKQIANRITEPYAHIKVLITSSNWSNFFHLRAHQDAQPEIHELAILIREAIKDSTPTPMEEGEWHLPYVSRDEQKACAYQLIEQGYAQEEIDQYLLKMSTARCARVSYDDFDGKPSNMTNDVKLFDKLVGSEPLHASPTEHQATPDPHTDNREAWGNFKGWRQYRKSFLNEAIKDPEAWKQ